jgi:hypothetical protein
VLACQAIEAKAKELVLQLEEKRQAALAEEAAKRAEEAAKRPIEAAAATASAPTAVELLLAQIAQTKTINKNNLPKIRRSEALRPSV